MIQANELKIGNFVLDPNKNIFRIDGFDKLVMLDGISYGKVEMYCPLQNEANILSTPRYGHPLTWELIDIEPIPITEDILLSNKFKYNSWGHSYKKDYISLSKDEDSNMWNVYFGETPLDIQYYSLHQLQNLYFLLIGTKLEITIEL